MPPQNFSWATYLLIIHMKLTTRKDRESTGKLMNRCVEGDIGTLLYNNTTRGGDAGVRSPTAGSGEDHRFNCQGACYTDIVTGYYYLDLDGRVLAVAR